MARKPHKASKPSACAGQGPSHWHAFHGRIHRERKGSMLLPTWLYSHLRPALSRPHTMTIDSG